MAFPSIYDFNYYKGDTFEFRIYPKKNDGTVFDLSQYQIPTNFANVDDYFTESSALYDSAQFTISTVRGSSGVPIKGYARVSYDGTHVVCAIRPSDSTTLVAGTEYVYDVEVRKPSTVPGSLNNYETVQTLLTGKITITDQVTGATASTSPITPLSNGRLVLTRPVTGAVPVATIIDTPEYSGTVTWSGSPSRFASNTVYIATINVTPRQSSGYTLNGIPSNFFSVENADSTNTANSGVVTATFPVTATTISNASISGVTIPVSGLVPDSSVETNTQFSGSTVWKKRVNGKDTTFTGNFQPGVTYVATITLAPRLKDNEDPESKDYTLYGVSANFFTVQGAEEVTHSAHSGIVTAVFPQTSTPGPTPVAPAPIAPTPVPAPIASPTPVPAPIAIPTPSPTPIGETPTASPIAEPSPTPSPTPTPFGAE